MTRALIYIIYYEMQESPEAISNIFAPGTPRRERRAIKREFDKIFKIFRKHCQVYKIDFKFVRPEK